jgi:hypothetical protein
MFLGEFTPDFDCRVAIGVAAGVPSGLRHHWSSAQRPSHPHYRVRMAVNWLDAPEDHDYDAAADYLSLVADAGTVAKTVGVLKSAKPVYGKAKDILRAAQLVLLSETDARVKTDLAKISNGTALSPILLVRGDFRTANPLQIADGYHRVCASYLTDENTLIPCRLVSWKS